MRLSSPANLRPCKSSSTHITQIFVHTIIRPHPLLHTHTSIRLPVLELQTGYILVQTFSKLKLSNGPFAVPPSLTLKFDLDENGFRCAARTLEELYNGTKVVKIGHYLMAICGSPSSDFEFDLAV